MSASREKNKRKEQAANPAAASQQKTGLSSRTKKTFITIGVVLFVVVVVFFTLLNSNFFANHTTAAVVTKTSTTQSGTTTVQEKLTPVMVNYFYYDAYNTYVQQYGDYLEFIVPKLDTNLPLNEQEYSEGVTWEEHFMNEALDRAGKTMIMYNEAKKAGITLSEEENQQIQASIDTFETYAAIQGASNADVLIAAQFGRGCNAKNFRHYLEITQISQKYAQQYSDSLTFTQAQMDEEYNKDPDSYDTVSYRSFYFSYNDYLKEDETEATDEEKAEAKADADAFLEKCSDEESFLATSKEFAQEEYKDLYEDETYMLFENQEKDMTDSAISDWLFDAARAYGDVEAIESDYGVYVVFFMERSHDETKLVNVRHILISVDDTTDEAAMDDARLQASDIMQEYAAGEQTEAAFAELAKKYSADGNAAEGGLYEDVYPGQMVSTFEEWCFDESRQVGDVGTVESNYGVHIIYFVGTSEKTYHQHRIEQKLKSDAYNAWETELFSGMDVAYYPGAMWFTKQ